MSQKVTNKRAVLLTATVIPNSIYTSHVDPQERLKEYLTAISFYHAQFPDDDIFLLENSHFSLEGDGSYGKLKKEIPFTLIKFPSSDKFIEGKGYQEFEMLDGAVDQLKNKYNEFIKITGRYIVKNAATLTEHQCNGITIDLNRRYKRADTFFFYFKGDFYSKYLKGEFKKVNDNEGKFIEKIIYEKLNSSNLYSHCKLFPRTNILIRKSGSYGITAERNPAKVFIRNIERFVYNILGIKAFFY